jgi:para-nitrobenzyl esterase
MHIVEEATMIFRIAARLIAVGMLFTLEAVAADSGPVVAVRSGQIQGVMLEKGGAAFKGIPYAQPPVGDLRWREPMPAKSWSGVRDASEFGAPCAQTAVFPFGLSDISKEDCLYLNVWTNEWPSRSPKPVMVWMPGGGNFGGAASQPVYDGESLARRGIVLVSLNYRLGVFGFFSHPLLTRESPNHASRNQGILDQIAALKWVRDNIAVFGGNPSNVTIFGESAGSVDVSVLMTSPLSRGLFHRAIAESGTVTDLGLGEPLLLAQAEKRGQEFAGRWGLAANPSLADLRAVSAADILKAEPNYLQLLPPDLGVTIDNYVFSKKPAEVFAVGQEHSVPLLVGSNARERIPGTTPPTDFKKSIEDNYGPLAERALALYMANADDPMYGTSADQWVADIEFRCSAIAQLMWHAAAGNAAFEYEFARVPAGWESLGATHATELSYLFGTLDRGVFPQRRPSSVNAIDGQVSDVMQQYWTNFAKTGDPNDGRLPRWRKFDASSRAYIQLTETGPIPKEGLRRSYCDVFISNANRLLGR